MGRLAAVVKRGKGEISVVVYDADAVLRAWSKAHPGESSPPKAIKGYALFKKPSAPCNGAWEVSEIVGPGIGGIVYGLGYALVPGGRLMPDRGYTSPKAQKAWRGASESGKLSGLAFDDVDHPQTNPKSDDCYVRKSALAGGPDPLLDVAYEGPPADVEGMEAVHAEVMAAAAKFKLPEGWFEGWLFNRGQSTFYSKLPKNR